MKRNLVLLTTAALVLLLAGIASADEKKAEPEKLDGKELYKADCKICHGEDADAGEYTPMFLIIEQWERFFDENYLETHRGLAVSADDTTKVVDTITPAMLKAIRKFCVDGAADSEHPMTCG
ncbi:cytochrome c [bacterium]|nr:cytochrome c [bacterium]MBU1073704.1 cytochrome c [bacterium]MBU1675434.1 cytochrome c [bacterium]